MKLSDTLVMMCTMGEEEPEFFIEALRQADYLLTGKQPTDGNYAFWVNQIHRFYADGGSTVIYLSDSGLSRLVLSLNTDGSSQKYSIGLSPVSTNEVKARWAEHNQ